MIEVTIKCESCGSFCYVYMDDPIDDPEADPMTDPITVPEAECSFCGEELV